MEIEEFKKYYIELCKENPKEASLFALSTLAMRHITKQDLEYYNVIKNVLDELVDEKGPELSKVRDTIVRVEKYDKQLIDYLSEVEKYIVEYMDSNPGVNKKIRG